MESARFPLICLFGVICFFFYQAWQDQKAVPAPDAAQSAAFASAPDSDIPELGAAPDATLGQDDLPSADDAPSLDGQSEPNSPASPAASSFVTPAGAVTVETDLVRAQISPIGGTITRLELKDYTVSVDDQRVLSLLHMSPGRQFVARSGLVGGPNPPTHLATFELGQPYPSERGQSIDLTWSDASGRSLVKTYTFAADTYEVFIDQTVTNNGADTWSVAPYMQVFRSYGEETDGPPFVPLFAGVAWHEQKEDGDKYRFKKREFEDLEEEPVDLTQIGGWTGVQQHYFLAAAIGQDDVPTQIKSKAKINPRGGAVEGYNTQILGARTPVEVGQSHTFEQRYFLGPKLQSQLRDVAPGLNLTVDYGWLTVLSEPLFWVLDNIHAVVGNWGWAIIILTILIKLVFYKLSEAQYRSMAKMRKFAPRIQSIKDRYGDDKQEMQKAMMNLYKKEGFNPLAGCWPMLVQFPVFIALYWVLLESVELRQAPWMLWIQDLSSPDPWYVLPVLFAVSMLAQQKLSGQAMTMDPMQQKIMTAMPIVMGVFFAFFPAGLVLYWLVSNLWGIAQQWYIYRKLDLEGLGKK